MTQPLPYDPMIPYLDPSEMDQYVNKPRYENNTPEQGLLLNNVKKAEKEKNIYKQIMKPKKQTIQPESISQRVMKNLKIVQSRSSSGTPGGIIGSKPSNAINVNQLGIKPGALGYDENGYPLTMIFANDPTTENALKQLIEDIKRINMLREIGANRKTMNELELVRKKTGLF